ncbi:hypothetical protein [Andreprevotia chitinilytica]|uniref:hypothetical protein n=1 Tax=Andreprevotia chitinilytica TaxID=396808 RepID=UPI0012EB43DE|nr:hypothetical protein [Andreprevotia chitinilytica]
MKLKRLLCAAAMLGWLGSANATYICTGNVSGLSIGSDGAVWAGAIGGLPWQGVCNVLTSQNGFDPATCKVLYAQLLAAQTTGKTVNLNFTDSGSCSTHAAWTWANTLYFVTLNP